MVGSESILLDSVSIHTHIGLSVVPKNLDMTVVVFPHTHYMNIFPKNVFDITNPTSYFFKARLNTHQFQEEFRFKFSWYLGNGFKRTNI